MAHAMALLVSVARARSTQSVRFSSTKVFDHQLKRRQRSWAASQPDAEEYDYIRVEVNMCLSWCVFYPLL